MGKVEEWREWKRQHPDFPLTVQANGQWSRKVRQKVFYFGPLEDPNAALQLWVEEKDHLLAGVKPPTKTGGLTVGGLLEAHLTNFDRKVAMGSVARRSRRDFLVLPEIFRRAGIADYPISELTPQHFSAVQEVIAEGRTLRSQKNVIVSIKTVFNWGGPDGAELYGCPVRFGKDFRPPKRERIEAEQDAAGHVRFIDRDVILAAIKLAKPAMRVSIFLGINCAFSPGDTEAVTLDHLHLDSSHPGHDFRRVKNGRRRMAALWPETVSAIQDYVDGRKAVDPNERRLVLTRYGRPYTRGGEARTLIVSFGRLLDEVGSRSKGVSLGSLRHTYATVVDQLSDSADTGSIVDLTMGHAGKTMRKRHYKQMNLNELERLKEVADYVRDWLFGLDCGATASP